MRAAVPRRPRELQDPRSAARSHGRLPAVPICHTLADWPSPQLGFESGKITSRIGISLLHFWGGASRAHQRGIYKKCAPPGATVVLFTTDAKRKSS